MLVLRYLLPAFALTLWDDDYIVGGKSLLRQLSSAFSHRGLF